MSQFRLLSVVFVALISWGITNEVQADPPGRSYPLVYGATGRPYGPTQANYQYQLRYGRPWHGSGSHRHGRGVGYVNGYPESRSYERRDSFYYGPNPIYYGLNTPAWTNPYAIPPVFVYSSPLYTSPFYSPYGYAPGVPTINHTPLRQGTIGSTMIPSGFQNDPLNGFGQQNGWNPALNQPDFAPPLQQVSSPAAQAASVRFQVQGDEQLAKLNYLAATDRYRKSVQAARDRATPQYKLAFTLVARSKFAEAIDAFKEATRIQPRWPQTSTSLDAMLGGAQLEKTLIKQRVADWVLRDSRDPNRLFLLGVMLHLDNDPRAQTMFETAVAVAGPEPHLVAFMRPSADEINPQLPPAPAHRQFGNVDGIDRGQPQFGVGQPEPTPAEVLPNDPNATEPNTTSPVEEVPLQGPQLPGLSN